MKGSQTFRLYINTDNDAFSENHGVHELARVLRGIADRLETVGQGKHPEDYGDGGWLGHYQTILDLNGNDVGRYGLKPSEER